MVIELEKELIIINIEIIYSDIIISFKPIIVNVVLKNSINKKILVFILLVFLIKVCLKILQEDIKLHKIYEGENNDYFLVDII